MKRVLGLLALLSLLFLGALISLPLLFLRSSPVEKVITERIEQISGGSLQYGSFQLSHFPFIRAELKDVKLSSEIPGFFDVTADSLSVRLARLPLMIGRMEISSLRLAGGNLTAKAPAFAWPEPVSIQDVEMKLGPLKPGGKAHAQLSGSIDGVANAVAASAQFEFDSLEDWNWNELAFTASFHLEDIALKGMRESLQEWFSVAFSGGAWKADYQVSKEKNSTAVTVGSDIQVKDLVYRLSGDPAAASSPPMNAALKYEIVLDSGRKVLDIRSSLLELPVGKISARGGLNLKSRELNDIRVRAPEIILEAIPQYFIGLKEIIPLNIGFSGQSSIEMALSGTWDRMAVHANADFTKTLLSYARYFSKPKDFPMNLTLDWLITDGKTLEGDFSLRLKDVLLKSTLTDVQLRTGLGQMNMISNKFELEGWDKLLPPIQDYALQGQAKFLANIKGPLLKPEQSQATFNFTVNNGTVKGPGGETLRDVNLALDYSPLSLEIPRASFRAGDSPLEGTLIIYTTGGFPLLDLQLSSEGMAPVEVSRTLLDVSGRWISPQFLEPLKKAGSRIETLFPGGERLDNFHMEMARKKEGWTMPVCYFDAYNGEVMLGGVWKEQEEGRPFILDYDLQKIQMARIKPGEALEKPPLEGNLFLKGRLTGSLRPGIDVSSTLGGEGVLLMTNGSFQTFDLMSPLERLSQFAGIESLTHGGTTPFHDFRTRYNVDKEKIATDSLIVLGDHYRAEGAGEIGFDRVLNFRLNLFLEAALLPVEKNEAEKYLDPVPVLISGRLGRPEVKADPSFVPGILKNLWKKGPSKALDSFLSEDFFDEKQA